MTNIVDGHDLDTQIGRADFRAEGGWVEGSSSGGYDYQAPSGDAGHGGGTQAPTQGATFNTGGTSSQTSGTPTATVSATDNAALQRLIEGQRTLLDAIGSGNLEAFREAIREFDLSFGLDKDRFAEGVRQFNLGFGISEAGLTGTYQGQPTQQALAQAFNQAATAAGLTGTFMGQPTLQAQQQAFQQGTGLINQVSQLQANPFRQQAAMGQLNRLLGGQGVAGFGGISAVPGAGTGGLGYLQQMIDDIRDPTANTASMNQVLDAIPTPNKLDSVQFFKSPSTTQNLVLQGMTEKYGIDPNDALSQIRNTLPQFQAPTTVGTVRR